MRFTRRGFLNCAAAAGALLAAERAAEPAAERKLFLFVDWFHVKKGELGVTLDPARMSPAGKKLREELRRDFNKDFPLTGHGMHPVDVPFGIRIAVEPAAKTEPWLRADQPWEAGISFASVIKEDGKYRCWYGAPAKSLKQQLTVSGERAMEIGGQVMAYAESTDGMRWTKPALGVHRFEGLAANNVVALKYNAGSVFRDDHGPASERYKMLLFDERPKSATPPGAKTHDKYGLYGVVSADGYHWERKPKLLIPYFSDTNNIAAWDAVLGKYVGFYRHHFSGRTISRAETTDFWNWPAPEPILYASPEDGPADDYYTNGYTTYPDDPSLRLLMASIYHRDLDTVDARLAVSRDGRMYQWVSRTPIVSQGGPGAWDAGSVYPMPSLVSLPDGRLAMAVLGSNLVHNETWFHSMYSEYRSERAVAWATWPDGRLAGIEARANGEFTTMAAPFRGTAIQINARAARGGMVGVELREKGRPLEGFTFAESVPTEGDCMWAALRWRGKDDLRMLAGRALELRFRLRSAKVFGFRFV
jgi:hypothetical protein